MPTRILLPLIVACALFMENLDSTVLSTALPSIAHDFGVSPIKLKLALTSYLLTIAVLIPASGWLADRFGARTIFRLAILLFTAGSICCGLSSSLPEIVASRILQGCGGAMMVPVGRLVILRSVPKSELVGSLAWLTVPALIGPILGPPVGGFITTWFDWRWIFWINVPIGVLGLTLATLFLPDVRGETRSPFDTPGFFLSGFGIAAFVTGSTALGLDLLPPVAVGSLIGAGGLALFLYGLHARRTPHAIIDLSLLRLPSFGGSVVGGLLFRIGVGATPFLLPLLMQLGFGLTPFQSGTVTFATAIGAILMKFIATPTLRRFGFRSVLIVNALVAGVFVAMPGFFEPTTSILMITILLGVGGLFRSLQFTATNALAYADVTSERMSRATSLSSVAQQLSISIGVSIGALALEFSTGGGPFTVESFRLPFTIVGGLTMLSAVVFLLLPRNAGDEVSGHTTRVAPDAVTAARERE